MISNENEGSNERQKDELLEIPSISTIIQLYRTYLWWALGLGLVVSIAFVLAVLSLPNEYTATSRIVVENTEKRMMDVQEVVDETLDSQLIDQIMVTHVETIKGNDFLKFAWDGMNPKMRERVSRSYVMDADNPDDGVELLRKWLKVERSGFSLFVDIKASHRNPVLAKFIADDIAKSYIDFNLVYRDEWNNSAVRFLRAQTEQLRQNLEKSELELQAYRRESELVSLEGNQDILSERLKLVSNSYTQARLGRIQIENTIKQVSAAEEGGIEGLISLEMVYSIPTIRSLMSERDTLLSSLNVLSETYQKNHPKIREIQEATKTNRVQLEAEVDQAVLRFRNQYNVARDFEKGLEAEMKILENDTMELADKAVEYNILKRRAEVKRSAYNQILNRLLVTEVTSKTGTTTVTASDRAITPDKPSFPNKIFTLVAGFALFLCVFIPIPPLLSLANKRLKNWDNLEEIFNVSVWGTLPRLGARNLKAYRTEGVLFGMVPWVKNGDKLLLRIGDSSLKNLPGFRKKDLVILDSKRSAFARLPIFKAANDGVIDIENSDDAAAKESLKSLHSRVHLNSISHGSNVLLFTSTSPNEGKSSIVYNLGQELAKSGKRTLVIDCDFRRPSLHRAFVSSEEDEKELNESIGLCEWYSHLKTNENSIKPSIFDSKTSSGLSFIKAGSTNREPANLILSKEFSVLVEGLKSEYDMILLDSPPAGVFSDTLLLTTISDEVFCVVKYGAARKKELVHTVELLQTGHAKLSGFILNSMTKKQLATMGYYRKDSDYGYSNASVEGSRV
ncbi:AAA family ATPase [Puniceicoccaceae bacterium K14]|nr:AAA family ATPase [Puniceicoccaceae bacterium K14]